MDERKKELQLRYDKKTKDLEGELAQLFEKETELKENQMRQIKEENLRLENFERQVGLIFKCSKFIFTFNYSMKLKFQ